MMAVNPSLPRPSSPLFGQGGFPTREWYDYWQALVANADANALRAEVEAIRQELANLPALNWPELVGPASVKVLGTLEGGLVTMELDGDTPAPAAVAYYGTDTGGARGYHPLLLAALGDVDLSGLADGDLLAWDDSAQKFVPRTLTDTDNLPEGTTNLYFTAARVRSTVLSGLSLVTGTAITAADSVLSAFGKLQKQIADVIASLSNYVPTSRTISTTAPLIGGGDLAVNRALGITEATASAAGSMSATDKAIVDNLGANYVTVASPQVVSGPKVFTSAVEVRVGTPSPGMLVGADVFSNTITPNVRKIFRIAMPAYNPGATLPAVIFSSSDDGSAGTSYAEIGGASGASGVSSVSYIRFVTASTYGEVGGASRWAVDNVSFSPGADNTYDLGISYNRPKQIWAANGTINTSDAREKTRPRVLSADEVAAASAIAALPCVFQWLRAIDSKGDAARLHVGPTVQDVIAAMESEGLDPFRYGFVCHDEWPEQQELTRTWQEERDETGSVVREAGSEVVQEYRPAGDRYSLRPSELSHFLLVALHARISALEGM